MGSFREIVTKAVLGKGKKTFVHQGSVNAKNVPSTVLGCWVINHVLVSGDNHCKIYNYKDSIRLFIIVPH